MKRDAFFLQNGKYFCGVCGEIPNDQLNDIMGNQKAKRSYHRSTDAHKDLQKLTKPTSERSDKGVKRKIPITIVEA